MKDLRAEILTIFREERFGFLVMLLNFVVALALFIFSIFNLKMNSTAVKIGYGDIGGYRDGAWTNLLVFPLVAVVFGVLHNFLAMRIFKKRGGAMMKFFLFITIALSLATFVVLVRLLRES